MALAPSPVPPPAAHGSRVRVGAWVLYDLANTIYAATLTFVFTPFAKEELGGLSGHGLTNFASMVVAGALVPALGALVDTTARTHRYLLWATLACVIAMCGWWLEFGRAWLLGCFLVANLTYNLAILFYNALLPAVAPPERAGRISGIGVGVGYLGTVLVLLLLIWLRPEPRGFFLIAAASFLLLALPCLLLVHDRRRPAAPPGGSVAAVRSALQRLRTALRELPRHRPLSWFLLGNFCLADVLNTAILYFAEFTVDVFRAQALAGELRLFGRTFPADDDLLEFKVTAGLALNGLAMVFGVVAGVFSDRAPLAVMRLGGTALLLALAGGAVFGGESALGYLVTMGALGAFGLAGIWTAGRKVVVLLAPPDRIGEYFGLYGITVKLSVVGAAVYGVVSDRFGTKPAMLVQSIQLLLGLLCLWMVRLPVREGAANRA